MGELAASGTPVARFPARAARPFAAFLEREAFPVVIVAVCVVQLLRYLQDELAQDGWLALAAGREVAQHGLPQHNDLTVWAHGGRWIDQPWLAQLAYYRLYAAAGLKLVLVANVALIAGSFALAIAAARRRGAAPIRVTVVAALSIPAVALYWQVRTQSFAYVLFVAVLWLLAADCRARSRRVFLVIPLLALWANLHGSVVLGATIVALRGVVGIASALRARRASLQGQSPGLSLLGRNLMLVLAAGLCVFASPYGFQLADYYHTIFFNPGLTKYIVEWQATAPSLSTLMFFVLLLGSAALAGRSRSLTAFDRLALIAAGVAGLASIRNVVWFGLAAIVLLPVALDDVWPKGPVPRRTRLNVSVALLATAVALVTLVLVAARPLGWLGRDWPPAAAAAVSRAVAERPTARVFSTIPYADWLLLQQPRLAGRMALDARVEILSERQLKRYYEFKNLIGDRWRDAAAGYDLVVLDPKTNSEIERALLRDQGTWKIYGDHSISVLARS